MANVFGGQRPDITPAQIVAVVGNLIAVGVAFGVNITSQQQEALMALAAAVGAILVVSDAHLRGRRANAAALTEAARITAVAGAGAATTAVSTPAATPAPVVTLPPAATQPSPLAGQ